eukprot:1923951-Rhodomonas_salina.1
MAAKKDVEPRSGMGQHTVHSSFLHDDICGGSSGGVGGVCGNGRGVGGCFCGDFCNGNWRQRRGCQRGRKDRQGGSREGGQGCKMSEGSRLVL